MTLIPLDKTSAPLLPRRDEIVAQQIQNAKLVAEKEALIKDINQLDSLRNEISSQLLEGDKKQVIELSKKAKQYLASIGKSKVVMESIKIAEQTLRGINKTIGDRKARRQALEDQIDVLQTDLNGKEDEYQKNLKRLSGAVEAKENQLVDLTDRVTIAQEAETLAKEEAARIHKEAQIEAARMEEQKRLLDRRAVDLARLQKRLEQTHGVKLKVK